MALCSGHSFLVLWHSHTMFGTWVYPHGMMCHSWHLYDLDLWVQFQKYFHHEFESGMVIFAFLHRHTIFWPIVYNHETTCCVYSWPLYNDIDLWPVCVWQGIFSVSFTHSFYLVASIKKDCWFMANSVSPNPRRVFT